MALCGDVGSTKLRSVTELRYLLIRGLS